ncbi:MAG TPA: hypothetical protein VHV30_16615 [Polyangiaceae bacterium]|jgi:hypothetical protein|nr:hypothetical protein [Polyangiaceae bacterium]
MNRASSLFCLALMTSFGVASCTSELGGKDAGTDAGEGGTSLDGGGDASSDDDASPDAGTPDATLDAGGPDATMVDAASDSEAPDAGADAEGALDATSPDGAAPNDAETDGTAPVDAEFDGAESNDGEVDGQTPEGGMDGGDGGGPTEAGVGDSGSAAQPHPWCANGASCVPANQCDVGSFDCASLTCVDTGTVQTNGAPCADGTCQTGVCVPDCAGPFGPCNLDPCNTGECDTAGNGTFYCAIPNPRGVPSPVPDGTSCGPHQVCIHGSCSVASCLGSADCNLGESCAAPAPDTDCTSNLCSGYSYQCYDNGSCGNGVADGTTCGSSEVCFQGSCLYEIYLYPATASFTAGTPFDGTVATVRLLVVDPSSLDTTVDWGDGTTSAGSIVQSGSTDDVVASHTYAASGPETLVVTVADPSRGTFNSTTYQVTVGTP